ncbi:UDP-glucose dehydrogenase family protein [Legionella impletisoli]|uniref:UDP-glucose 6-dehydrogenase n=1 Tax=Legionella impletisoli TaxID=343510 RepID=A0A917JXJ3_9GAMM|nr:UDP-glucose/GDP-mannose dehydrogenase family protein [Legionella impletisoli]GGI91227.1 UDP-glucose 6-dehydrogenase [Legionella impletisoli]
MNISVYGAGYVGLVSGVCFAHLGHNVLCVDIDEQKISRLKQGNCTIFENQLPELLKQQLESGRLSFSSDTSKAIEYAQVHIIATGTPSLPSGEADLSQVLGIAEQISLETQKDTLIVTKSTVPVGTGDKLSMVIADIQRKRNSHFQIQVASNPEFLREGRAVSDFLNPDRIILGGDKQALEPLEAIYKPLVSKGVSLVCMSRKSAELTKYSANAMLACKISFMNQISLIAEEVGADIEDVRQGMSLDHRIGPHFIQAGIGYGGSCFPKDIRALKHTAFQKGINASLLDSIDAINNLQKNWVFNKLAHHFNHDLKDRTIAIWGLSFKPGTDDIREASSLVIIHALLKAGVKLRLYDPVAMTQAKKILLKEDAITWCSSAEETLQTSNLAALVIATEWDEFKSYPLQNLAQALKQSPLIDGRNCFSLSKVMQSGIAYYYSVGRPMVGIELNV